MTRHLDLLRHAHTDEAGEGVISTAIAVLIMALIGGLMWIAFQTLFTDAADTISGELDSIQVG